MTDRDLQINFERRRKYENKKITMSHELNKLFNTLSADTKEYLKMYDLSTL